MAAVPGNRERSAASRIGGGSPVARPVTMVPRWRRHQPALESGFDIPTIRAATDPRIRLPRVNTGAAYASRDSGPMSAMCSSSRSRTIRMHRIFRDSPRQGAPIVREECGVGQVRACGLRRYTPCVL